jgi:hypothetical protein
LRGARSDFWLDRLSAQTRLAARDTQQYESAQYEGMPPSGRRRIDAD